MRYKILLLLFSLFFVSSFLISSHSLITYCVNTDNTYYVTIPSKSTQQSYTIPIGHYLPLNWSAYQTGSQPINFAGKSVGLHCKLYVDSSFSYPEKCLRYYDVGGSHQILTWFGLKNASSFSGYVDFIIYNNQTITETSMLMITFYNSSLFTGKIFDIWVGSDGAGDLKIKINYVDHGALHQQIYYFPNENIMYLSVYWDFLYNSQNVVGLFENLSLAFDYTCKLDMVWYDYLYASSQWLKVWTTTIDFCDVAILGFDSSAFNGFYRFRCFNFTFLSTYGYYSTIIYNLPLTSVISNLLNPRIYKGNATFSVYSNIQDYSWVDLGSNRINLGLTSVRYGISATNNSALTTTYNFFDISDRNSQIIQIRVKLTLYYDYIDDSFSALYINAGLYLILLVAIPFLSYKIFKQKSIMFWVGLFITDITIVIYLKSINLGSVLSIASVLIILIGKMRSRE